MAAFVAAPVKRRLRSLKPATAQAKAAHRGPSSRPWHGRTLLTPLQSSASSASSSQFQRMEDTYAENAGKDLFFAGMDERKAIEIITQSAAQLRDKSDRYIAAERLKFYPSEASTDAVVRCIEDDEANSLEDRIAKRKALETLGRYDGAWYYERVRDTIVRKLQSADPYTAEVAVWSLARVWKGTPEDAARHLSELLERDDVNKRVVIQALAKLGAKGVVPQLRQLVDSPHLPTACAAMGAVSQLTGETDVMNGVYKVLRSTDLNVRRAAIEDITITRYQPALDAVVSAPNALVLRSRAVRELLEARAQHDGERALEESMQRLLDRLIWDHPQSIDLLEVTADTKKARSIQRCVERLYKNDALYSYLGAKVLLEDHRNAPEAGEAVLKSFEDMEYFDYFAAYHVFKTLGWLRCAQASHVLLQNFRDLPPRFFNHQAGAALALALNGERAALEEISRVALTTRIWELKYACMIAAEKLDDGGELRKKLAGDSDWLVRARAQSDVSFSHLRDWR